MKKFLFFIVFFVFSAHIAFADIVPANTSAINKYGIGTLNLPNSFCVYSEPDETSKILKKVDYEAISDSKIINNPDGVENTLIVYVPEKNVSLVAVETDEENGWFEIYYDQKNGKTGWVYDPAQTSFRSWRDTFYYWGKQNGIYFFKDVPEKDKKIYSQDSSESQFLYSLTKPRSIHFSMIRGNWMVVQVQDLDMKMKIGWLRWRQDDGNLLMFPYFKKPLGQF